MKISYLLLSLAMLAVSVNATSPQIAAFLKTYNVSSSTISSLTSTNITYQGKSYTELFLNSNLYLLVNTTNAASFSFVFNTTSIANIIRSNIIAAKINTLGIPSIRAELGAYLNSSAGPLYGAFGTEDNCLADTGLNVPGASCTVANGCEACTTVPTCSCAAGLTCDIPGASLPPPGSGVQSIINFEANYTALNSNIAAFYSSTTNVSTSNLNSKIAQLNSAFSNISYITQTMGNNTVFPPPEAAFSGACNLIGTTQSYKLPWYCTAVGICPSLTYNNTQLAVLQGMINTMNGNAPTTNYINNIALSVNATETAIITPLIVGSKTVQLDKILNTTLANYTGVTAKATILLSHLNNASLAAALSNLENEYASLKSGYLSLNLTAYSVKVESNVSKVEALYAVEVPLYSRIQGLAKNNTAFIIALQSNSQNPGLAALAYRQDELNLQASSQINSSAALMANLTSVQGQAKSLEGISLNAANSARDTDGPFATSMARLLGFSYPAAVASIPLFASIQTLIIDGVIFLIIYGFYNTLRKHNRIQVNRRTSKAWRDLFIILLAIIVIHILITYYYASAANASAPISIFQNAVTPAKAVGIVVNGTVTPGMSSCANILYNETLSVGKTPTLAYVSRNACSIDGSLSTAGSCLNGFVFNATPFIVLTNANSSSIRAYSFYGTALYASGEQAFMSSCYPSFFIK